MVHPDDLQGMTLINNNQGSKKRFELEVNGKVAFMDYMIVRGNVMYLTHTEVPKELEGRGVGSAIVNKVLSHIRKNELKMAPLCPFLASYLQKHPGKADDILADGFKIG